MRLTRHHGLGGRKSKEHPFAFDQTVTDETIDDASDALFLLRCDVIGDVRGWRPTLS